MLSYAVLFALIANFCFSLASLFYAYFALRISSTWINFFKSIIAGLCFFLVIVLTQKFHRIEVYPLIFFALSGIIGLGIGDIFLIKAFSSIGPGRTMMLFSFHPVFVGIISFFLFQQKIPMNKLYGIIFFILCLLILSIENFKKEKSWNSQGLVYAIVGMGLDAVGIILTRQAFDWQTEITAFEGNLYRCLGAIIFFIIFSRFSPINLISNFKKLEIKLRTLAIFSCILGTFLSLSFYLKAIQTASQLAMITAISITSVVFSTVFESLWKKSLPSKFFWMASASFMVGMYFVLF